MLSHLNSKTTEATEVDQLAVAMMAFPMALLSARGECYLERNTLVGAVRPRQNWQYVEQLSSELLASSNRFHHLHQPSEATDLSQPRFYFLDAREET